MIALFNSTKTWGGGEWWHYQFAEFLKQSGREVIVFAHPKGVLSKKCQDSEIPWAPISVGNLSFLNPIRRIWLAQVFQNLGIDHLIINGSSDLKFAGLSARQAKLKRITYRRGLDKAIRNTRINRYLIGKIVDDLLCNTEATKRSVLATGFNINSERIRVIPNPIDTDQFSPLKTKSNSNNLRIGAAGRLVHQKGFDLLLKAMVEVEKEIPNVSLRIAGTGDLAQELKKQVLDLGLKKVEFMGFEADMVSFYRSLDLFAFPSRFEGFGFALAEAMSCGLASVAFDVSSNPELIADSSMGNLISAFDVQAFAKQLIALLKDDSVRQQTGANARTRIVSRFNRERIEEEWSKFINE